MSSGANSPLFSLHSCLQQSFPLTPCPPPSFCLLARYLPPGRVLSFVCIQGFSSFSGIPDPFRGSTCRASFLFYRPKVRLGRQSPRSCPPFASGSLPFPPIACSRCLLHSLLPGLVVPGRMRPSFVSWFPRCLNGSSVIPACPGRAPSSQVIGNVYHQPFGRSASTHFRLSAGQRAPLLLPPLPLGISTALASARDCLRLAVVPRCPCLSCPPGSGILFLTVPFVLFSRNLVSGVLSRHLPCCSAERFAIVPSGGWCIW